MPLKILTKYVSNGRLDLYYYSGSCVSLGPAAGILVSILGTDNIWLFQDTFLLFLNLRIPEIHLFYNLQDFYWHFLEILWLFIFLFLYSSSSVSGFYFLSWEW